MAKLKSDQEVEEMIAALMEKGKGNYITQSVLFKKDNPRHIELLRKVLTESTSFGEYVRKVLAVHFENKNK